MIELRSKLLGGQNAEHLQVELKQAKEDLQSVTEQKNKLSESKQVLKKVCTCTLVTHHLHCILSQKHHVILAIRCTAHVQCHVMYLCL